MDKKFRAFYDKLNTYPEELPVSFAPTLLKRVGTQKRILDIGCGGGIISGGYLFLRK